MSRHDRSPRANAERGCWPMLPEKLGISSERGHSPQQKGPLKRRDMPADLIDGGVL